MKVLAIGDMHTKNGELKRLLDFGIKNSYDCIILVGDYMDDFSADPEDNIKTLHIIDNYKSKYSDKIIPLVGNHDFAYAYADELYRIYCTNEVQSGFNLRTLARINQKPELRDFIKSMPAIYQVDGVAYSHAGLTQSWWNRYMHNDNFLEKEPLDYAYCLFARDDSPLWIRPHDGGYSYNFRKQVFGHTPAATCEKVKQANIDCWCIDTFSTHADGTPIGDRSVLQIIDGKKFEVIPEKVWSA